MTSLARSPATRAATVLVAAAVAAGCAVAPGPAPRPGAPGPAPAPGAERFVAPPAGAWWVVRQRNSGSFGAGESSVRTVRVDRRWMGVTVPALETPQGTLVLTPRGEWDVVVGIRDRVLVRWDPPVGFDYPLWVGKRWTREFRSVDLGNRATPIRMTCEVQADEAVTVVAGTFRALRVGCVNSAGVDEVSWLSPDHGLVVRQVTRRTPESPLGAGTRESEVVALSIPR